MQEIIPDPVIHALYVAAIEPGSYLEFAKPVSFNGPEGLVERGVLNEQQRVSGRAQSAVRPISTTDFNRILDPGLSDDEALLPASTTRSDRFSRRSERRSLLSMSVSGSPPTRRASFGIGCSERSRYAPMASAARSPGFGSSTAAAALKPRPLISGLWRRMVQTS